MDKTGEKIKKWLKDKQNLILLGIIVFTVITRLYYFSLTYNQPLWYDEADYLNIAKSWIGKVGWHFNPLRPVLFPLVASLFYTIGLGEISLRILILVISITSIPLIHGIGKLFFNKKVGLISAFILSIFWSFSFYSFRLLIDVPLAFLWLVTIYTFFNSYFKNKSWKHFVFPGILLGLAFLLKAVSFILVLIFAVYLLTTEKINLFKSKPLISFWLSSLLTVLPYFIWQYVKFGDPLTFYYAAGITERTSGTLRPFFQSLIDQISFSVSLMYSVISILFVLGLIFLIYNLIIRFDSIFKKNSSSNKYYFIILWFVLSIIIFGWLNYGAYMEERYYFVFYPAVFFIFSYFLEFIYEKAKTFHKVLAVSLIILLLVVASYQNLYHTDQLIKIKKDSFIQPKLAGEWLEDHTVPNEKILVAQLHAEIQYYSEREIVETGKFNSSQEIIDYAGKEDINYAVIALYYPQNIKTLEFEFFSNGEILKPVQAYTPYVDNEGKIPILTIFEIK